MKKITLFTTILITLISFSCSREAQTESNDLQANLTNNSSSARGSQELSDILKSDEDFVQLVNLTEIVINMPDKDDYINNFNAETLENSENGNLYLASISGYDLNVISNTNITLVNSISNLQTKYPELIPNGENQEFIIEIINQALAENTAVNKKSCKDCAREGRANIVAGIFLGGATGSIAGFYGAWIGAVVGFWAAGEQTVTCLRAAGC